MIRRVLMIAGLVLLCGVASAQEAEAPTRNRQRRERPPEREAIKHTEGVLPEVKEVKIDPLGAPVPYPWTVHEDEPIAVRSGPAFDYKELGALAPGAQVVGDYFIVPESDEEWLRIEFNGEAGWIARINVFRPHPTNIENVKKFGDLPYGTEIVNRWWALPSNYEASDLMDIPSKFTTGREGSKEYQMRKEACEHLVAMFEAAEAEGIKMRAGSPYRSWPTQQGIYGRNVRRNPSQRSSAPPGHSEHQIGSTTDISFAGDRNGFLTRDCPEHAWLEKNAAKYGFRQTYLPDNIEETGYIEEPWHWRYFGVEKLNELRAGKDVKEEPKPVEPTKAAE